MEKQLIFEKIAAVMAEIDPIAKERKNTQQGYNFRGVDDLMNAISPLLTKHKIFPTTNSVENVLSEAVTSKSGGGGTHLIRRYTFRFFAEDGSYVDTIADGEAIDYGDKASNKAQSVAYREAMFKMFVIPFQNEDIEEADHDIKPAAKPAPAKPAAKTTVMKPEAPKGIAEKREAYHNRIVELCEELSPAPLLGDEEISIFVKENTGFDFEPQHYLEIGMKLAALKNK